MRSVESRSGRRAQSLLGLAVVKESFRPTPKFWLDCTALARKSRGPTIAARAILEDLKDDRGMLDGDGKISTIDAKTAPVR